MRYALFALVLFLPWAMWWQSRGEQSVTPAPPPRPILRGTNGIVLVVATLAVAFSAIVAVQYFSPVFVDDAYITYRYSQNLAAGHGLTWNAGEAPLEGYTNLLLVLLMSPVELMGGDPLFATRLLSLLAVLCTCWLLYRVAVVHLELPRPTAYLLALAYPVATMAIPVAMIGLETSLYTMVIFAAFCSALDYFRDRRERSLILVGALCFLALLLRPGAVFLPVAAALGLLVTGRWRDARDRRAVSMMLAAFAVPLMLYLLWKLFYFGTVIPNPARIKMAGEGYPRPLGFQSMSGYFLEQKKLLMLALVSLSLPSRLGLGRLVAALLIAAYATFYSGVDTLMDVYHRFLHPMTPFLYFLALPTLALVTDHFLRWKENFSIKLPVVLLLLTWTFFLYSKGPVTYLRFAVQAEPLDRGVEGMLDEVSRAIAAFERAEELTIMSQDAGLVPYRTRARHLDTAGLNDRGIARGGDPMELANSLFAERPQLILHRGRDDGRLLDYAHGPLGDQTSWAMHPGWDSYRHLGSVDHPGVHNMHFFVRLGDELAEALGDHLILNLIQHGPEEFPLVLGSRRTAGL